MIGALEGKKLRVGSHVVSVQEQIGEGAFAFVHRAEVDTPEVVGRVLEVPSSSPQSDRYISSMDKIGLDGLDMPGDTGDRSMALRPSSLRERGCVMGKNRKGNRRCFLQKKKSARSAAPASGNKRLAALKVSASWTAQQQKQYETEVAMLKKLSSHRNIVTLLDKGVSRQMETSKLIGKNIDPMNDDGCSVGRLNYLLLEHCEGGSLMDLLLRRKAALNRKRSRPSSCFDASECQSSRSEEPDDAPANAGYLDRRTILNFFGQITDAVAYLHNQHDDDSHVPIIHRDIKPENILLAKPQFQSTQEGADQHFPKDNVQNDNINQWECKLCDFGSAVTGKVSTRSADEKNVAEDVIRRTTTKMYRAPEMIELQATEELTEKTDIWALGCCLYTMCFLRNIFDQNSNLAILKGTYVIPEEHPYGPDLVELIHRMLVVDPTQRAGINEVKSCLEALRSDRALPARVALPVTEEEEEDEEASVWGTSDEWEDATAEFSDEGTFFTARTLASASMIRTTSQGLSRQVTASTIRTNPQDLSQEVTASQTLTSLNDSHDKSSNSSVPSSICEDLSYASLHDSPVSRRELADPKDRAKPITNSWFGSPDFFVPDCEEVSSCSTSSSQSGTDVAQCSDRADDTTFSKSFVVRRHDSWYSSDASSDRATCSAANPATLSKLGGGERVFVPNPLDATECAFSRSFVVRKRPQLTESRDAEIYALVKPESDFDNRRSCGCQRSCSCSTLRESTTSMQDVRRCLGEQRSNSFHGSRRALFRMTKQQPPSGKMSNSSTTMSKAYDGHSFHPELPLRRCNSIRGLSGRSHSCRSGLEFQEFIDTSGSLDSTKTGAQTDSRRPSCSNVGCCSRRASFAASRDEPLFPAA